MVCMFCGRVSARKTYTPSWRKVRCHHGTSHYRMLLQRQCTRFLILLFIANVVSYPWYPIVSGASLNRPGLLQSRFLPPSAAGKGERIGGTAPGPPVKGLAALCNPVFRQACIDTQKYV